MNKDQLLEQMDQLIGAQLVVAESGDHFAFRHALTREAAYATLLRRERAALHHAVATGLERLYADAPDAYLGDLAYHYYEAGTWTKALQYAQRAGEQAQSLYAPREALGHFTRALDAARHLSPLPAAALYRARGQAHETLGDFDAARGDYEHALQSARDANVAHDEWQSLLDLGMLWTGRDFKQAGDYLQRAQDLARGLGDPATLAYSLNRTGNWQMMTGRLLQGLDCHREALAIFQAANDRKGQAATLDLLGITSYLAGDMLSGAAYYAQAIPLFRELGDRPGLVSSLAVYAARGGHSLFETAVCPPTSVAECSEAGEEALALARQIGWRTGEAIALLYIGLGLGPKGEYARALEAARGSLAIALEIEHAVLIVTAHMLIGALLLDVGALPAAHEHFEAAQAYTGAIGSPYISATLIGFLASVLTARGELDLAEALLRAGVDVGDVPQIQSERRVWCARAELALARGKTTAALAIAEQLIATPPAGSTGGQVIPRLGLLHAKALHALERDLEAEPILHAARQAASDLGLKPLLWRIDATLGRCYHAQGRTAEAERAFAASQSTGGVWLLN